MTERAYRILSGVITLLFIVGAVYFGVKVRAAGALRPVYQVNASFDAAGQGLQPQSDVKVHGVTIGRVRHVSLRSGRAWVRMDIDQGQRIPTDVVATIRPKTLFGEKFVDLDPGAPAHERRGPFLRDEGRITRTVGGFELEKVLTELYPILKAVRPEELSTVIGTLAGGARGEGAAVNRQIVNWDALSKVMAQHDADTRQFLDDLADLSGTLADRAGEVVGAARDLNVALPPLNARGDELAAVLDQTSRLSGDAADVLDANQEFQRRAVTEGGQALQVLADRTAQVGPLVTGLRQYFQVQAEVSRIPFGDGTVLAAVKYIVGEDCPNGRVNCGPNPGTTAAQPAAGVAPDASPVLRPLPAPASGVQGIVQLIEGLLR